MKRAQQNNFDTQGNVCMRVPCDLLNILLTHETPPTDFQLCSFGIDNRM